MTGHMNIYPEMKRTFIVYLLTGNVLTCVHSGPLRTALRDCHLSSTHSGPSSLRCWISVVPPPPCLWICHPLVVLCPILPLSCLHCANMSDELPFQDSPSRNCKCLEHWCAVQRSLYSEIFESVTTILQDIYMLAAFTYRPCYSLSPKSIPHFIHAQGWPNLATYFNILTYSNIVFYSVNIVEI